MKKNIKLSLATLSLIIITIGLITLTSCNKSNSSASFPGTYIGTLEIVGVVTESDTVVISAGSMSSSVVMVSKTSRGSTYTIAGTVNGSSLSIPSQSIYVPSLSMNFTVSGSGSLNGSTLTTNQIWVSPSQTSYHYNFTGTKQ